MRTVKFQVEGLPPRKDAAQSMWGSKNPDHQRVVVLRQTAVKAFESQSLFEGHVTLNLVVHADSVDKGDLANFIGGVCDSLQAVSNMMQPKYIADPLRKEDMINAFRPIAYKDDKFVTTINAQLHISSESEWYEVELSED
jgi:hypothetical protein